MWLEQGLYLLWQQGASVAVNFLLRDVPHTDRFAGASGVYFNSGKEKPSHKSFRFPFVTHRISSKTVSAWGKAPESGQLQIQRRGSSGWVTIKSLPVNLGQVFTVWLSQSTSADLRAKIGSDTSLSWHQG